MIDLNKDSITVNMVVKTTTDRYRYPGVGETSLELIRQLIDSGEFTTEFIPSSFTKHSTGTLIITEKE